MKRFRMRREGVCIVLLALLSCGYFGKCDEDPKPPREDIFHPPAEALLETDTLLRGLPATTASSPTCMPLSSFRLPPDPPSAGVPD